MKTQTLLWKISLLLLLAGHLQAASVSLRLSGSVAVTTTVPKSSLNRVDAYLDEDGGANLSHLVVSSSDYFDAVDCASFGIHCDCDIRPQVSQTVNLTCGKT